MTELETVSFTFQIPDGWDYFCDDSGRLVCHGSAEEELIISVNTVKSAMGAVSNEHLEQVFANALSAIRTILQDPELLPQDGPRARPEAPVPCVFARATSRDGLIAFSQMVFRGAAAVAFATLETPESPAHDQLCSGFVSAVKDRVAGTAA